jgi:hypothetical protein
MVRKGIFVAHAWWPANLFADGFGWYHQVRLLKSCHNLIQRLSASILLQKGPPVLHYRGMKDTMDILFVKKYNSMFRTSQTFKFDQAYKK